MYRRGGLVLVVLEGRVGAGCFVEVDGWWMCCRGFFVLNVW